jgi:hypothetical protein
MAQRMAAEQAAMAAPKNRGSPQVKNGSWVI